MDHWENFILTNFGDRVSISEKNKTLRKFGRNPSVGTSFETVQQGGGDETYLTSNDIVRVVSDNAGDSQLVQVEGHTISNGELTFVIQTATLNGTTNVTLDTPLARCTRLVNLGTTDFAGTITAETSGGTAYITVTEGNQSEKCSTSVSNNDYYIITEFTGYCFDKSAATIEFIGELREVGETNKVFRRVFSTAGSNGQPTIEYFEPPFIIPKNYDIRVRAKADGAGTDVGATFNGYLAKVT